MLVLQQHHSTLKSNTSTADTTWEWWGWHIPPTHHPILRLWLPSLVTQPSRPRALLDTHTHILPQGQHTHHTAFLLALSPAVSTAQNNTEIFPGFLLPDLHLTLPKPGEMSGSPVTATVETSYNVSKWEPGVWLSGKWAEERNPNKRKERNSLTKQKKASFLMRAAV